jgi:hypothetical protein
VTSEEHFDRVFGPKRGSGRPDHDEVSLPPGQLEVERDEVGQVLRAVAIRAEGRRLTLAIDRRCTDESHAECSITVAGEDAVPINAVARIQPIEELASFEIFVGDPQASNTRVSWVADFTAYEENHLVLISGEVNGFGLAGVMDPRSGASSVQLTLEDWIEPAAIARLRRFAPIFREMDLGAREERAEFEDLISHTIDNSRWSTIGRAACCGLGGVAAGVCCIATHGIGCLVAYGLFGAAGSVCSEKIGPALDRKTE